MCKEFGQLPRSGGLFEQDRAHIARLSKIQEATAQAQKKEIEMQEQRNQQAKPE